MPRRPCGDRPALCKSGTRPQPGGGPPAQGKRDTNHPGTELAEGRAGASTEGELPTIEQSITVNVSVWTHDHDHAITR